MLGRRPKPAQFDPRDGAFSERREEARHVPRVRRIVEAAIADRLPEAEYPRVGGGGRRRSSAGGAGDDDEDGSDDDDDKGVVFTCILSVQCSSNSHAIDAQHMH